MYRRIVAALAIAAVMAACEPARHDNYCPRLGTATQPAPSWAVGQDPGCYTLGVPVAGECLEGGAPQCATEDGNDGAGLPCWWVDPDKGDVWYRP
jgi:hypothetical protein